MILFQVVHISRPHNQKMSFSVRQHLIEKIETSFHYIFFGSKQNKLFFLEIYISDVEVDLGLLLERHGVQAEAFEGLDLALILVNIAVVQVDIFWRENAVCKENELKIKIYLYPYVSPSLSMAIVLTLCNLSMKIEFSKWLYK